MGMIQAIKPNLNFSGRVINLNYDFVSEIDYLYPQVFLSPHARRKIGVGTSTGDMTHYVFVQDLVFVVTRPEPYSFFEKALLPLDAEVWWWLIGFLAFGVMVIVVVSFMSRTIRNFVFGMKVKAPLLNMM
jgi:hypothetical protein